MSDDARHLAKALDLNDQHIRGQVVPVRPPVPMTAKAKREAENAQPNPLTVKDLLTQAMDRALSTTRLPVFKTGHWMLDEYTGGLRSGHVWVIGADTSWGKSTWAVSFADLNMTAGNRVLIVSVEDPPELYGRRLLARRSKVSAIRLRDQRLNPEEMMRVTSAVAAAQPLPFFLDARTERAEWVAKHLPGIIADHEIRIVIVDYLQEMRSVQSYTQTRDEVSAVAKMLREAIKGAGAAGIFLSQLTIEDPNKPPTKHMIRESRNVSNAAEGVMLGWTPAQDFGDFQKGKRYLLVDKAKDGIAKRYVELEWDDNMATFLEARDPYEPPDYLADLATRIDPDAPVPDGDDGDDAGDMAPLDGGEAF